ncbi:MAG: NnrS protein involved in response to NO [Burkholderiaceae bacterium]|jgi:uncharacterized protein involved in response to NO|nr:MAG: NnrS protein involved in response to NO [Burkholderiaceae bacterium]
MKPPTAPVKPADVPEQQPLGLPLLRLGFRPFYLGAAALAAIAVPVWVAVFFGLISFTRPMPALLWHAHEMLYGFAAGVIMGFLLTAVKAWTGLQTPRGPALGALALLWLAARIAAVVGPYPVYAALDIALLPLVALTLLAVLLRAKNRRNLPLVLILGLMAMANLTFHLAVLGVVDVPPMQPLYACLALIVMVESVITGRVVPAFMNNATPGLGLVIRRKPELLTLAVTALALAAWVFAPVGVPTMIVLLLAALLHVRRWVNWRPWAVGRRPILWVLYAAYAWIPIGLALLAFAALRLVPNSPGVHALAVGATGGLILGMVTRTARGHTGRPLKSSGPEILAYALVLAAAVLRVLLPLISPALLPLALIGAAAAWSGAFAIYLVIYAPWLLRARIDGKDG